MRLRRKDVAAEPLEDGDELDETAVVVEPAPVAGPIDASDLDEDATYLDLGSLLLTPPAAGLDLRLQVDEASGEVLAVLLVGEEGVLELRAFASSRGGDLWDKARAEIAADTTSRGGTAKEQDGPFGPELFCEVPVTGPDDQPAIQPSRVLGWTGPRWFLRATIAGRPAVDPEYAAPYEEAFRTTAVRRGSEAMAPGEALALRLPPEARPQTDVEAAADAGRGPNA